MTDRSTTCKTEDSAEIVPTREGYDRWASSYDTDGNPLIALEEPWMVRLLGDVRGLTVLDLGCGTGRHALRLASAGAEVQALDFSSEMLSRAHCKTDGRTTGLNVMFRIHDLCDPLPFLAQSFDRVVCGLVVDHIADLAGLFAEMRRVCRPAGSVVVSVMHPAMMLRGVQARFHDQNSGREIRPASYPHQLSDYVLAGVKAGFALDHLSEHAVDEELANRLERARRYLGWPMLLLLRLRPAHQAA